MPVALLVMVMDALGITAPVSSVMLPLTIPVGACPKTLVPPRSAANNINLDTPLNIEDPFPDSVRFELTILNSNCSLDVPASSAGAYGLFATTDEYNVVDIVH
jgi:hypothetical protein